MVRSTPRTVASPEVTGKSPAHARKRLVLPAPFGAHDHHDLSLVEREIDPGEGGEAAGERDRGTEENNWGHGLRPQW